MLSAIILWNFFKNQTGHGPVNNWNNQLILNLDFL